MIPPPPDPVQAAHGAAASARDGAVVARLSGVHKAFDGAVALRDVDAAIPAGIVGLLGPNGAGKTTLLRLLLGLERADSGALDVLGWPMPAACLQARSEVGYMPEDDCLFPDLNGVEQVVHAARLSGMSDVDAFARAHEMLDLCGISEARHRPAAGYSLGMRQRLRLAMAIAHGPLLVLLDEPTAGLDPAGRQEMLELIGEIGASGTSVILSTHVLADVEAVCDHVLLLTRGRPGFCGPKERFVAGSDGDRWQLDIDGDTHALSEALQGAGIAVWADGLALSLRLQPADHALLWRIAAEKGVGVRGFRPAEEAIGDAFLRHLGLDDPDRRRSGAAP